MAERPLDYVSLAMAAGAFQAIENAIHAFNLNNLVVLRSERLTGGLDFLIAPLAYLVVLYWLSIPVIVLLLTAQNKRRGATSAIVLSRPPRDIQGWALAGGLLSTGLAIPYFWAISTFNISVVVALLASSIVYLLLWDGLLAPYLLRFDPVARWLRLTQSTSSLREIWLPIAAIVLGIVLASVRQIDIVDLVRSVDAQALFWVAGVQQGLAAMRIITGKLGSARARQQAIRRIGLDAPPTDLASRQATLENSVVFWRMVWSAVSTTVVTAVFAWWSGRLGDLMSVWVDGGAFQLVLSLLVLTVGLVCFCLSQLLIQWSYGCGGQASEVILLCSLSAAFGVVIGLVAMGTCGDCLGPQPNDYRVWIVRVIAALAIVSGIFGLWRRERAQARQW